MGWQISGIYKFDGKKRVLIRGVHQVDKPNNLLGFRIWKPSHELLVSDCLELRLVGVGCN